MNTNGNGDRRYGLTGDILLPSGDRATRAERVIVWVVGFAGVCVAVVSVAVLAVLVYIVVVGLYQFGRWAT